MGKIYQGVYGGVSGKIGNLIGSSWKGIHYLRIKAVNVANPNTVGQQNQRLKFSLIMRLLQPLHPVLQFGFKNQAVKMTPFNSAVSYNIRNAFDGQYPNLTINYEKVVLSHGLLPGAENPLVSSTEAGKVDFTWADNSDETNATEEDNVIVVVYCDSTNQAVILQPGIRELGTASIQLPASWVGKTVQTWIVFQSFDGRMVSNSTYAGEATIV